MVNLLVAKEEVHCEAYHIPLLIQMMEGETIEVHHPHHHQGGQKSTPRLEPFFSLVFSDATHDDSSQ